MANHQDIVEFKNENVDVQATRLPGCVVKFEITVHPQATEAAYKQAVKSVKKEVSIPGFRKGKASDSLVTQHYSSHIEKEFRDVVVQTAYREAINGTKIYPLNEKSIKQPQLKSCSKENGAKVIIEIESFPNVPTINPKDLDIKKIHRDPVSEKQVEEAILGIREHHAQWEDVTDRPIEKGDYVEIDVDAIEDPAHNICSDTRFEVKKGHMADWMIKLVVGHRAGDIVEGVSEKQHDDHVHTEHCQHESHEKEFKPTLCRITIKSVKKAILPEIDDELAKKVGLKSVNELPKRVQEDLERQTENLTKAKQRHELDKALAKQYDFEVPASLVQKEFKSRLANKLKMLRRKLETEESIEKRKHEIEADAMKEALEELRLFFIARDVAENQKITVTQDEILKELSRQMWGVSPEESVIDSSMQPEEIRSRLYLVIMSEKAKDLLIEEALKN